MSAIKFYQEEGGNIRFDYDTTKFYAVSQTGTSVPLWEGELIFVPKKRCSCTNPSCTAQENHFAENEILGCLVPPEITDGDAQPYAGKHSCWVSVQLFDQDKVDAAVPAGMLPCVATFENGAYHVHEFLWK